MEMDYGIQPFWFWNGEMTEQKIEEQIKEMYAKGIYGYVLCARQGLKTPYLSKRWFELVAYAVDVSKTLDMDVWLYDEQPYPSGISGGRVVLDHPEFEAKEMHCNVYEIDGSQVDVDLKWGKVIFAKAYPLDNLVERNGEISIKDPENAIDLMDNIGSLFGEEVYHEVGLTIYNRKRFLACEPFNRLTARLPEGKYKLVIFNEVPMRGHKYYDRFIDPINSGAIKYFIETTHELYKKYLGHEFGKTIKGIFTDEIHPIGYEGAGIPWSPLMPELYERGTGRSIFEDIVALKFKIPEWTDFIRYQFMNILVETFIDSYDRQIQNWCKENGILYIGEKPILRSKQLKYMDIPGIDAGHQKAGTSPDILSMRYRANGKILSSAAHFYNKPRCLCECFHSIGWGMEIQDMKWTYDWLLAQGVNMFVNHAYFYTTQALKKHDAPSSGFFQMPWWKHQKPLSDYIRFTSRFLTESKNQVEVILLDPITSTWTKKDEEEKTMLKMKFEAIQRILFDHGIDFYIMDQQLLESCQVSEGKISYKGETFNYVLLPEMTNIETGALKKVLELIGDKGMCYCVGSTPQERIDKGTELLLEELASKSIFCKDGADLIEVLRKDQLDIMDIYLNGKKSTGIFCNQILHEEQRYFFVTNSTNGQGLLKMSSKKFSYSGYIYPFGSLLLNKKGEDILSHLNFEPYGKDAAKTLIVDVDKKYFLEVTNSNALRLHYFEMSTEYDQEPKTVNTMPIIDQLAQSSFKMPVVRQDRFGTPKTMVFSPIHVTYNNSFMIKDNKVLNHPLYLRIEEDGLLGMFEIDINGYLISKEVFILKSMKNKEGLDIDITDYCVFGLNVLKINVYCEHSWEGLLNPIYIIGKFLVDTSLKYATLVKETNSLCKIGEYIESGLPFYAGDLIYKIDLRENENNSSCIAKLEKKAEEIENIYVTITDQRFRHACQLKLGNVLFESKAYSPYIWEIPKGKLIQEDFIVELIVSNTLLGYFEGQFFEATDQDDDRYQNYSFKY